MIDKMGVMDYSIKEGDLLTTDDICRLLKVKKPYIYQLTHKGKIPFIKIEGIIRFRATEISKWLQENSHGN
jgi:excisionase family DNA binding protein